MTDLEQHIVRGWVADAVTQTRPDTTGTGTRRPRLHAYPDGSRIALCGRLQHGQAQPHAGDRCPDCVRLAGQRHHHAR